MAKKAKATKEAKKTSSEKLREMLDIKQNKKTTPLHKTTIVIWSEYDPKELTLEDMGREADSGNMYASKVSHEFIKSPETDKEWSDGLIEFFSIQETE